MDNTVSLSSGRNSSRNTIRTDLSLLLECLKFQMKSPDLQKQALLTIHSICENREEIVDMLREMGGVAFVYNLSKSSIVHSDVKATALFTLGTLAEANVYCKNSLCRKEIFVDVAGWLMKDDIPLTQKRVSVYLLSVLVANNKSGQTLAQTTDCLDILLDLFRTTFPLSKEATLRAAHATQTFQLWASVSSALCGCVNNPQNDEAQRICVAAFPIIKIWLKQITLPRTEIFQPICSFIAMTVANNSCVQESFSASGALVTLTLALVHQASAADTSLLSCQLSVTISKTLSACITDNSSLASGLAQYGVVPHLFSLLASPHLDPEDRLSVLLTLGHCTESSEEHQAQLVQCGGLPFIITLLTEDTSEEVRKGATFILQTCKQATMSLGVPGLIVRQAEGENGEDLRNMEDFRSLAGEMLHRLNLLEQKEAKEVRDELHPVSAAAEDPGKPSVEAVPDSSIKLHTVRNISETENVGELKNWSLDLSLRDMKAQTSRGDVWCSACKGTGSLMQPLEGGPDPCAADNQMFKPPAPMRMSVQRENKNTEEELQGCKMSTVRKLPPGERSLVHIRCAGCVLSFEEVNSRTFASLQSSCLYSCDMHKVLQEATEKFRTRHCNLLSRRGDRGSIADQADSDSEAASAAEPQRSWKNWKSFSLTPLHRGAKKDPSSSYHNTGLCLTPLKRSHRAEERRGADEGGHRHVEPEMKTDRCSNRRKRNDFSPEEVRSLLSGVKTYGFSWNSILWSYPFKPGRTNVGLAKKYRQLMVAREDLTIP